MTTTLTPRKEQAIRPFFEEFFASDPFAAWPGLLHEYAPPMDLYNHDGVYVIEAALPGLEKKDIAIEIEGNRLTVTGKYAIDTMPAEKARRYHYRELRRGSFYRSVAFPEEIDQANVVATFNNGILKVEVPSLRSPEPKKVVIK